MVRPPSRQAGGAQQPNPDLIQAILKGIRVPDLPYPLTREEPVPDWLPVLADCWREQQDRRVIEVLQAIDMSWSVRQVNAAYLADRMMDVFLAKSGLHPTLVRRVARLRFLVAWQIAEQGAAAIGPNCPVHDWVDSLHTLRGWSDSGGRAARQVLTWLDQLQSAVDQSFQAQSLAPFEAFTADWRKEQSGKDGRIDRLSQRLLETEQGASRQRAAEQVARALVGRAIARRALPAVVTEFITHYWLPLLRQVAWQDGVGSENARHAAKLLEWLVWVADPNLSDRDRDKLYHVGEQLGDKIGEVWNRVQNEPLPAGALQGVEELMVARLRGSPVELEAVGNFTFEPRWLNPPTIERAETAEVEGRWFVEGEGEAEQRMHCFAFLEDSQEILWTNGEGVKLGLMTWQAFQDDLAAGRLRPLPAIYPFAEVVSETLDKLEQVLRSQVEKRREARAKAEAQAEKVRRERAEAEKRRQEEAERVAREQQQAREREEAAAREKQAAEEEKRNAERLATVREQVDSLKLGNWITLAPDPDSPSDEPRKLKLAVRLNATGKLIFVDRLGLNRTEMTTDTLVKCILSNQARLMSSEADFEDTLSRVVGRIRVGR
ncbi:DUF1631 family protein [Marinobacter bohaiensis]|uniref:DUF1631 family protein n=1 Tax=Marinobacter bohaiensis TaxID=2201898 RepID=UPI000DADF99F|nr:DUF1631 family protein [Marinobacter bohaiensis]